MKGMVKFRQGDRILLTLDFPLDDPERIREFIDTAFEEFRSRYPGVSLFDGVTVEWDKAD